jgi:hypothetical protein
MTPVRESATPTVVPVMVIIPVTREDGHVMRDLIENG